MLGSISLSRTHFQISHAMLKWLSQIIVTGRIKAPSLAQSSTRTLLINSSLGALVKNSQIQNVRHL